MSVRIVIADDHDMIRKGLRMTLEVHEELTVAGEAANGREALAQAEALSPDVVIMDISMPELNGIEATRLICQRLPGVKVLIFSMHYSSEHCFRALSSGARGYILKESAGEEIVTAVRSVMRGRLYFGAGVENPLKKSGSAALKSPLERLSQREREIFQLVVEGKSSAEIARMLTLSSKSIDTYRSRLMQKLGINNLPALVHFALQHGITPAK